MRAPPSVAWEDLRLTPDERTRRRTAHTRTLRHVTRRLDAAGVTILTPRPARNPNSQLNPKPNFFGWRMQETLDYADVLEACSVSRARYTIIIEEDAFPTPDFFRKVTAAIRSAEFQEEFQGGTGGGGGGGGGGGLDLDGSRGRGQWWIKLFVTDFWSGWASDDMWTLLVCKYIYNCIEQTHLVNIALVQHSCLFTNAIDGAMHIYARHTISINVLIVIHVQ